MLYDKTYWKTWNVKFLQTEELNMSLWQCYRTKFFFPTVTLTLNFYKTVTDELSISDAVEPCASEHGSSRLLLSCCEIQQNLVKFCTFCFSANLMFFLLVFVTEMQFPPFSQYHWYLYTDTHIPRTVSSTAVWIWVSWSKTSAVCLKIHDFVKIVLFFRIMMT